MKKQQYIQPETKCFSVCDTIAPLCQSTGKGSDSENWLSKSYDDFFDDSSTETDEPSEGFGE